MTPPSWVLGGLALAALALSSAGAATRSSRLDVASGHLAFAEGTPAVSPPAGTDDLPLRTWIARPLPKFGTGPCPNGCKHMRLAHHPHNGRIYFLGGDYDGPLTQNSGRNELYSYSIREDTWVEERPYCGPAGEVQPDHPDEVGWAFDTKRSVFWMLPGYLMARDGHRCPEGSTPTWGVMTFDPSSRKWQVSGTHFPAGGSERSKFAHYDPVTDSLIAFRYGPDGNGADIYRPAANKWERVGIPSDTRGTYINNSRLSHEYSAMDPERRVIYVISPYDGRLLRYNMDKRTMTVVSRIPALPGHRDGDREGVTIPVWDSVNKVLLYPYLKDLDGYVTLHIYRPDTNTWERDQMVQPEGLTVRGNSAVFDPQQNALLIMGGLRGGDLDDTLRHFFLYRYGNGAAKP